MMPKRVIIQPDGTQTEVDWSDKPDWNEPVTEEAVRDEGARRLRTLVASNNDGVPYTIEEMMTWPEQTLAVVEYLEDPAPTEENHPALAVLAAGRGISLADMVTRISTKRAAHLAAMTILSKQAALLRLDPIPADYQSDRYWT